ncbi:L,D-transpeptidase family protein [Brevundimonas variabilis]|uniref:Lipoprotein-anchoring transpeptidase ErfK/SrfK n=1 Tax=Brevundimonas variabilis TaxID=74312 RepID=A0A7W9FE84_9CAUL|nr:L,D-transpeptidase [Brevundimonas variabilis]MBB5746216.1 lipoprotein-anchoring transpeptidase ErfK/SrfK [Brevundimonas variabilis]
MRFNRMSPIAAIVLMACSGAEPANVTTEPARPASPVVGVGSDTALRQAIETATFQPGSAKAAGPAFTATSRQTPQPPASGSKPAVSSAGGIDPGLIRAQILLDRAAFSPGVIDGLPGENSTQAIAAYEKANGLPEDGILDAQVFARLVASDKGVVLQDYTLTTADIAGPYLGTVPESLEAQAELESVGYATIMEGLAERFHTTEALLATLNPGADLTRSGTVLVVPAVSPMKLAADVARITVDKTERSVRAYDASDRLIAFYPATIGSAERPAPSGTVTVVGVAPEPNYTYDPTRVTFDRGDKKLVIPAGPNNPVGSVWIDLSRDTYGIHGTPDPSKIGKTFSSGCVRLTNWDAEQLAASVKPGVEVRFL